MAISDILSDAVSQIETYLEDQSEFYSFIRPRLDTLLAEMNSVRAALDTPLHSDGDPYGVRGSVRNAVNRAVNAKMPDA